MNSTTRTAVGTKSCVHLRLAAPGVKTVGRGTAPRRVMLSKGVASKETTKRKTTGVVAAASPVVPEPVGTPSESSSTPSLKSALLDALYGTERGLTARGEVRAKINELILQLEAQNPTPSPTSAVELLNGSWKLVYTSNSELIAALALSRLPFVTIGDITQKIDGPSMTVQNQVQISVPFTRTSFSTTASLEVRSPSRLQVKFEEGIIHTPELLEDIDIPNTVSIMGQTVDVSNVASALKPFQSSVRDAVAQIGNLISQQPDLKIPIASERSQTWLLTTFLDKDTRILRGDRGSVYVLVKDVSIAEPVEVIVEEPGKPEPPLSIEYNEGV